MSLSDIVAVLGLFIAFIGMLGSLLNWFLSKWEEKNQKIVAAEGRSRAIAVGHLESVLNDHTASLQAHGAKLTELEKQLILAVPHQATLNDNCENLGNLMSAVVKVLQLRPDLLEAHLIGGPHEPATRISSKKRDDR